MKLNPDIDYAPDNGLLLVDKPQGWTSHDVVNMIRRRFRIKKVGHCGTLDPLATGLLIIVTGKATKAAELLSGADKEYKATFKLGQETSSYDSEGDVTAEKAWDHVTEEQARDVVMSFLGEQEQLPPMVSAVKQGGKKLYELARKGITVERKTRKINVSELVIDDISLPNISFTAMCSKGTYIRTLCHDMAEKMGTAGHMTALVRTQSSGFSLKDACQVEEIKTWELEDLIPKIIPLGKFLRDLNEKQKSEK